MTAFDLRLKVEDLVLKIRLAKDAIYSISEELVNSQDILKRDALGYAIDTIMSDIHAKAEEIDTNVFFITENKKNETEA